MPSLGFYLITNQLGVPILPEVPSQRGTAKARCKTHRKVHNQADDGDDGDVVSFVQFLVCSRQRTFSPMTLLGRYYDSYYDYHLHTEEETEAYRGQVTCPRSQG